MAKPPAIRRIVTSDFPEELQEVAEGIGAQINQFQEDVISIFNGNIDFDNLNRQLVQADIRIDGAGKVINRPSIKVTLHTKVIGINCINAVNLDNPSVYPTQAPFVSFTLRTGYIDVLNVSGLQNNSQYRLTLELIG